MGRFTKAPVLLDATSQLTDRQIRAINNTLKSQYNRMMSQGFQKQKQKPEVDTPYSSRTNIVDDLQCYSYNTAYWYSFKIDLKLAKAAEKRLLLRIPDIPNPILTTHGIVGNKQLSEYGYITYEDDALYITMLKDGENVAFCNVWIISKE